MIASGPEKEDEDHDNNYLKYLIPLHKLLQRLEERDSYIVRVFYGEDPVAPRHIAGLTENGHAGIGEASIQYIYIADLEVDVDFGTFHGIIAIFESLAGREPDYLDYSCAGREYGSPAVLPLPGIGEFETQSIMVEFETLSVILRFYNHS